MAKKPTKVDKAKNVERTVYIPGWAYNFVIDRAQRERRDVKAELSLMLERAIVAEMAAEGKEPGQTKPAWLVAA
jgi:hypothetical protein